MRGAAVKFLERAEDLIFWAVTSGMAALATGVWWLIRLIFTNQQQIELVRADLAHRAQQRDEDRERIANIERSVERIEQRMMGETKHDH